MEAIEEISFAPDMALDPLIQGDGGSLKPRLLQTEINCEYINELIQLY